MAVTGFANGIKSADGAFSDGPVAATTTLYRMAIVMRDGSGNLINGATVAGAHGVGVAAYNDVAGTNSNVWDNSAGIAGAITAKYLIGIYGPFANSGTSITAGMEGKVCYCLDNVTVHATSNAGARSPAGVISRIDSSGVWVLFDENIVRALAAASGAGGSTWTQTYSTANRTVAAATDAALTDSTTGTAGASMAAGAGVQTLAIPITLASITANGDVLTNYTPGYRFKVLAVDFAVGQPVTTVAKLITLNLEIDATNVTGGAVALTSANCTPLGALVAGSAVTAANVGTSAQTLSVEASGVTAFVEGDGMLLIKLQNMDTADAFASLEAKRVLGIADDLDNRQSVNGLIDDLQAAGIVS